MEIEEHINKNKEIYLSLIKFIEMGDDQDKEFQQFVDLLEKKSVLTDKQQTNELFKIISNIESNYHRTPDFISKLCKIFNYIFHDHQLPINDTEICEIFIANKLILFHLLEKKFLKISEIFNIIYQTTEYRQYLYPVIKESIDKKYQTLIEKEILSTEKDLTVFESNCKKGENNSYICSLIREDSIEEFITFITQKKIPLNSTIISSIYETNSFLIGKNTTLIQYAAFYGSINIINYMRFNNVSFDLSIFLHAIHSKNAELIYLLEDDSLYKDVIDYDELINEAIKCHHNDIVDHLINKYKNGNIDDYIDTFIRSIVISSNYYCLQRIPVAKLISLNINQESFKISDFHLPIKKITIPSSVNHIGSYCFAGCKLLETVIIPSSVISIGPFCFQGCTSLKTIELPSSIVSFGSNIFNGVTKLEVKGDIKVIPTTLFYDCKTLKEIILPPSVNRICTCSFCGCPLTKITFQSSSIKFEKGIFDIVNSIELMGEIKTIYSYLFSECYKLTQITIPSSVTTIEKGAFLQCKSLKHINIHSNITSIQSNAFDGCKCLENFVIPPLVESIENSCFANCSSLVQITIPSSVKSIGRGAFNGCSSLKQIDIQSNITSIKNDTFNGCKSLAQIKIPSSVTSIDDNAFLGCSSLIETPIPPFLVSIGKNAHY